MPEFLPSAERNEAQDASYPQLERFEYAVHGTTRSVKQTLESILRPKDLVTGDLCFTPSMKFGTTVQFWTRSGLNTLNLLENIDEVTLITPAMRNGSAPKRMDRKKVLQGKQG